jgi:hypothetical protein
VGGDVIEGAEAAEHVLPERLEQQAVADRLEFRRAFEDVDAVPRAGEQPRDGAAGDAAPDDGDRKWLPQTCLPGVTGVYRRRDGSHGDLRD